MMPASFNSNRTSATACHNDDSNDNHPEITMLKFNKHIQDIKHAGAALRVMTENTTVQSCNCG